MDGGREQDRPHLARIPHPRLRTPAELAHSQQDDPLLQRLRCRGKLRQAFNDILALRVPSLQRECGIGADGRFGNAESGVSGSHARADTACEGEGLAAAGVAEAKEGHGVYNSS